MSENTFAKRLAALVTELRSFDIKTQLWDEYNESADLRFENCILPDEIKTIERSGFRILEVRQKLELDGLTEDRFLRVRICEASPHPRLEALAAEFCNAFA